ncbi:MAG: adenosine deaminase [Chloroflexota bacterium]|nr:adenosine deaminase [Chloroflexota bacterium]
MDVADERMAERGRPAAAVDVALLARMPKAELHLHLDGSVRPQTALQLARERGLDEGMDLAAVAARLRAPDQCRDQAELLEAFQLPIRLLQDREALERVTHELVEDAASDGTRYVEIRWAPALHVAGGLDLRQSIAAVVGGARSGAAAARGCTVRLIAVAMRSHPPQMSVAVAHEAARFIGDGLTGFDLAGPEAAYPDPLLHADAFAAARAEGLGITLHAGESGGAAQVWRALEVGPARIAHGAPAADDPALTAELAARGVTLDLCPTSNVQAGIVARLADHPLPHLARSGVPVTLSTDDRTVSGLTLVEEYRRAIDVLGLSIDELWRINMHVLRVAFLHHDEALRRRLIGEFEEFAAREPELASTATS